MEEVSGFLESLDRRQSSSGSASVDTGCLQCRTLRAAGTSESCSISFLEWPLLCSLLGGLLPGWTFECCSLPMRMHVSQVWAYGENPGTFCACVTVSVPMSEPVDLGHVCTCEGAGIGEADKSSESIWSLKPWAALHSPSP